MEQKPGKAQRETGIDQAPITIKKELRLDEVRRLYEGKKEEWKRAKAEGHPVLAKRLEQECAELSAYIELIISNASGKPNELEFELLAEDYTRRKFGKTWH